MYTVRALLMTYETPFICYTDCLNWRVTAWLVVQAASGPTFWEKKKSIDKNKLVTILVNGSKYLPGSRPYVECLQNASH